jgi:hypothetical protein
VRPRTEVGRNSFPTSPTFPVYGCPDKSLCGPGIRLFINIIKGWLQLAAITRTTREGLQHGDPQGGTVVPRGHKEETGGGQDGGRYRTRAAAEAAAVT